MSTPRGSGEFPMHPNAEQELRVYIWDGNDVLRSCGPGMVVVTAESVEHARELALVELMTKEFDWMSCLWPTRHDGTAYSIRKAIEGLDEDDQRDVRDKIGFLDAEPRLISREPGVWYRRGSD